MLTVDEWQSEWGWGVDMMRGIVPASFFRFAMRVHDESSGKSYLSKRRRRFEGDRMPLVSTGRAQSDPTGATPPFRIYGVDFGCEK